MDRLTQRFITVTSSIVFDTEAIVLAVSNTRKYVKMTNGLDVINPINKI